MFNKVYSLLSTFICVVNFSNASLVPFIKPYTVNDNDCLVAGNIQIAFPYLADEIPELGISAAEPMEFENITMNQGYFKRNYQTSTINITLDCPVEATGDYKLSGKICTFDMDKEGEFKMQSDAIRTTIIMKTHDVIGSDKKKYWNLINYEYVYEIIESLLIELAGLFEGDVTRAQRYLSVVDQAWGNYVLKIGEPITSDIVNYFYGALKAFFQRVPIDEIAAF